MKIASFVCFVIYLFFYSTGPVLAGERETADSLRVLDTVHNVNVRIDYSKATFDGLKCDDALRCGIISDNGESEILARFLKAINKGDGGHALYYSYENPDCKFFLTFYPISISQNGDIEGYALIHDGNITYKTITDVIGRGGVWGSFINLIGDGMERVGESLGVYIKSVVLKNRKIAEREKKREKRNQGR